MKLIIIDETQNNKEPKFYGVCGICIDVAHYPSIVRKANQYFQNAKWNTNEYEFKGRFLFSSSKGDITVSIDDRISLAENLVGLNIAQTNAKMKSVFAWNLKRDTAKNHFLLVKEVVRGLLPSIPKNNKEKPCIVFAHRNNKIPVTQLWQTVNDSLHNKNYVLVEDVHIIGGWRDTHVGLCMCDLFAYLASWICITSTPKKAQLSLFNSEGISAISVEKTQTVEKIFKKIKAIKMLRV